MGSSPCTPMHVIGAKTLAPNQTAWLGAEKRVPNQISVQMGRSPIYADAWKWIGVDGGRPTCTDVWFGAIFSAPSHAIWFSSARVLARRNTDRNFNKECMGSMPWFRSGSTHTFSERPLQEGPKSQTGRPNTPLFKNKFTLNPKSMLLYRVDGYGIQRAPTCNLNRMLCKMALCPHELKILDFLWSKILDLWRQRHLRSYSI